MPRTCQPETCEILHSCSKCKIPKACTEYYRRGNVTKEGRDRRGERVTTCKGCGNSGRNKYRIDPQREADYMLGWKYGLTREQWSAMLAAQGGGCAICRKTEPGGRGNTFHVDHDHACCPGQRSCGKCVRGLLCSLCNTALGYMSDEPSRLRAAADYLEMNHVQLH